MSDNLQVRPEGGEHPFIRLLDHGYGGACFVDGDKPVHGGTFRGRNFVELKVQGDSPVTPGALISQYDEQDQTVRMHRDPLSGIASPVTEMHPVICTVCLQAAHREASLGDTTEIWQERTRERQRADQAERRVHELETELAEVKEGLRLARPLLKVLQSEQGTDRPPKRAAKPSAKEAA